MDGSERKEKNERQQGAAEEKERDNGAMGKKGRGGRYRTNHRHYVFVKTSIIYEVRRFNNKLLSRIIIIYSFE
jgi:hypothetical protein